MMPGSGRNPWSRTHGERNFIACSELFSTKFLSFFRSPLLNVAAETLTDMGYKFDFTNAGGTQVITAKFTPQSLQGNTLLLIITADRDGYLQCLSKIFNNSPADKRAAVIEAVMRANYGLRVGAFQMDYRDGEILYKSELPLSLSTSPDQLKIMIRSLISCNLSTHDRYYRTFRAILYENKTAEEAIAIVEGPGTGGGSSGTRFILPHFTIVGF